MTSEFSAAASSRPSAPPGFIFFPVTQQPAAAQKNNHRLARFVLANGMAAAVACVTLHLNCQVSKCTGGEEALLAAGSRPRPVPGREFEGVPFQKSIDARSMRQKKSSRAGRTFDPSWHHSFHSVQFGSQWKPPYSHRFSREGFVSTPPKWVVGLSFGFFKQPPLRAGVGRDGCCNHKGKTKPMWDPVPQTKTHHISIHERRFSGTTSVKTKLRMAGKGPLVLLGGS